MSISGCSKEPRVEIRYVDRIVEKIVQTPCEVPAVTCYVDTNTSYTLQLDTIGRCIEDLNVAIEVYR